MFAIIPSPIGASSNLQSSAAEAYAEWAADVSYAPGSTVLYASAQEPWAKRVYTAIASSTGLTPSTHPLQWADIAPSNRWAAFDAQTSTQSVALGQLTISLATGRISALALVNLTGTQAALTITDGPGGAVLYATTQALDGSAIVDAYSYCFEPFVQRADVVFAGIPPFASSVAVITITGDAVGIGHICFGLTADIGALNLGASVGIKDYSRKDTDEFGVTTFVKRGFSKKLTGTMRIPKASLVRVYSTLAGLRASPTMYVGSDDIDLGPLTLFGTVFDFSPVIDYPMHSLMSIEIEGLA